MKLVDGRTVTVDGYRLGSENVPQAERAIVWSRRIDDEMTRVWNIRKKKRGTHVHTSREIPTFVVGQISERKLPRWVKRTNQAIASGLSHVCGSLPDWPISGRHLGRMPRYARLRVAREQQSRH
jgi:hypothetical protein